MSNSKDRYYTLDPAHTDSKRVLKEREKARKLKKTQWWLTLKNRGVCHYCQRNFKSSELTMDHIVPIARGGVSAPGNVVPACRECNQNKKLATPAEDILDELVEGLDKERAKDE